jgi:hypothetical protein
VTSSLLTEELPELRTRSSTWRVSYSIASNSQNRVTRRDALRVKRSDVYGNRRRLDVWNGSVSRRLMDQRRSVPEFKDEVGRQVIDRLRPLAEMVARLGLSRSCSCERNSNPATAYQPCRVASDPVGSTSTPIRPQIECRRITFLALRAARPRRTMSIDDEPKRRSRFLWPDLFTLFRKRHRHVSNCEFSAPYGLC